MIEDAIKNRRSIRKFKENKIPAEMIDEILEAARLAPSGKNKQPWKFMILCENAKAELLAEMESGIQRESTGKSLLPYSKEGLADAKNTLRIMKEAPTIIMVLNPNGKSPFESITSDERFTEIVDTLSIGAAIENILLQAEQLEIGTLWIANTCFAYPELIKYLNTKAQLIGAIAMGYPDEKPLQRPRKQFCDMVEYRA